jgi:hypothetical protein
MRYRLILLPLRTPKGPWRDTYKAALQDALEQDLAVREEHDGGHVYLHALAEIEWRE